MGARLKTVFYPKNRDTQPINGMGRARAIFVSEGPEDLTIVGDRRVPVPELQGRARGNLGRIGKVSSASKEDKSC